MNSRPASVSLVGIVAGLSAVGLIAALSPGILDRALAICALLAILLCYWLIGHLALVTEDSDTFHPPILLYAGIAHALWIAATLSALMLLCPDLFRRP